MIFANIVIYDLNLELEFTTLQKYKIFTQRKKLLALKNLKTSSIMYVHLY